MTDSVGVGMIGVLGWGARGPLKGWPQVPGAKLVAVADIETARAEALVRPFGADVYADYQQLLDRADIDVINIATPSVLHYEIVMAALAHGKHVLCEKPFASTVSQATEMFRAAEAAGVVHAVDFELRFFASRNAMYQLVRQGFIGEPRLFMATDLSTRASDPTVEVRPWAVLRERFGGPIGGGGIHEIDAARWLMGDVHSVTARLDTFFPERTVFGGEKRTVTSEDMATILFRYKRPAAGTLSLTFLAGQYAHRVEMHGDQGSLIAADDLTLLGGKDGEPQARIEIPDGCRPAGGWTAAKAGSSEFVAPFVELASRVVARIRGEDGGSYPTFKDGLESQKLLDAVLRSSDTGQAVLVSE